MVGNSGQGAWGALLMVHRDRLSSVSPHTARPGAIRPGPYTRIGKHWGCALLRLRRIVGEGGVDFAFFDAVRGIPGLAEILLFGAVAHHAGMRRSGFLIGVFAI